MSETTYDRVPLRERFEDYHHSHPEVYDLLVRLAREAKERGQHNYGMKAIFERARWHYQVECGQIEFALRNEFTPLFARLIMERESDLAGFFETRKLRSTRW